MNSRWQANKIGLVNFWYYDEQEFYFLKGRMLLRGSNGSGKSVTMQSVVPLLLDGNLSPERLDPFGTRDRKMNNYLLEEEDEREERTGYLYLEFKREESETYHTVGMGMRARKGKPMEKWYFYISDGRRVNQDFYLYKELDDKVTLSKKELEYRLGTGGGIIERQAEYTEYVNRQIFGFASADEYKEMIDLLIQLRTPKLSKDFKPSVINDILSDSLQPLSDDDLRPMSEAIENMDSLTANLKTKLESQNAARKIQRVYEKYNRFILFQKTLQWKNGEEAVANLLKNILSNESQLKKTRKELEASALHYQELEAEQSALEKEKESLNASDAVSLKEREEELGKHVAEQKESISEKEKQLTEKQEKYVDYQGKLKQEEERCQGKEEEQSQLLHQMSEHAEDLQFSEHVFFQDELLKTKGEEFQFQTHMEQTVKLRDGIEEGLEILRHADSQKRLLEEENQKLDREKKNRDTSDRKSKEKEAEFTRVQNEYKESLYRWNGENKELILPRDLLREISDFADEYSTGADYSKIRQKVADVSFEKQGVYNQQQSSLERVIKEVTQEAEQIEAELKEWKNQKEPEPDRSEAVLKNRERLKRQGIPYREFYKVIEFDQSLSEEQCNHLEEALLSMGILDALIVEEEYRQQVLKTDPGLSDRYLFTSKEKVVDSLLPLFDVNGDNMDMFLNRKILGILESIGYNASSTVSISPDGSYQMGVLTGTVTHTYEAGYIGVKARERKRQAKIAELLKKHKICCEEKEEYEKELNTVKEGILRLKTEYECFPAETGLREAYQGYREALYELEQIQKEIRLLEERIREMSDKLRSIWERAVLISEKLYLKCRLDVFEKAKRSMDAYLSSFYQLKNVHLSMIQFSIRIQDIHEIMGTLDEDMDTIRYDKGKFEQQLRINLEEIKSIQEQLKLTNYEEIKERLNHCVKRLSSIPGEKEECVATKTNGLSLVARLENELESQYAKEKDLKSSLAVWKDIFRKEYELKNLELPETEDAFKLFAFLEPLAGDINRDEIVEQMNRVYFENRGYLVEYQLSMETLFDELEEEGARRMDIRGKFRGTRVRFSELLNHLADEIEELNQLIRDGDRELFEDILANTISRKIRNRINGSLAWVDGMNRLMGAMNTSSGLKLSLKWRSKTAETEDQLDTKELVELLKKDYRTMREEEAAKLSAHFRSKVEEARRNAKDGNGAISFYGVMRDTLDYRKWFEFQLFCQKSGEKIKELTNSVFGTFSGGEKAMSMYVPLFSAVVAKYKGAREDAPRMISLDEAFAGVDNRNIRDMFRLMVEFEFNFIINSQVLWGDCDTLDGVAIYQLLRPDNAKFVTVMSYVWNGRVKKHVLNEQDIQAEGDSDE